MKVLTAKLSRLRYGLHSDENADYSPIIKEEVVLGVNSFFQRHEKDIVFGGKINMEQKIIPPTVIVDDIS